MLQIPDRIQCFDDLGVSTAAQFIHWCESDTIRIPSDLNWIFYGTSGVHGTYTKLDEVESQISAGKGHQYLTVLVVMTRAVRMNYGHIRVDTVEECTKLRSLLQLSMEWVQSTQADNL